MLAILADPFVRATVMLVLAARVPLCRRRSPASLRPLVWTLACGGVLALPLASALLPNWRVAGWPRLAVPVAFNAQQVAGLPETALQAQAPKRAPSTAAPTVHEQRPAPSSTVSEGSERWRLTPDWTTLVLPVWLSGVGAVLILLAIVMARIMLLDRVARPVRDGACVRLVAGPAPEFGGHRRVRVCRSKGAARSHAVGRVPAASFR